MKLSVTIGRKDNDFYKVVGKTYPIRHLLKKYGAIWMSGDKEWLVTVANVQRLIHSLETDKNREVQVNFIDNGTVYSRSEEALAKAEPVVSKIIEVEQTSLF
jgi:CRISPR/Cas system-associated protein Cas5 (RAMP superfamily)